MALPFDDRSNPMLFTPPEYVELDSPDRSSWQTWRDLALCALVACAIALIVGFLAGTFAHARDVAVQRMEPEVSSQSSARLC